jgi:hypothetical protein
MHRQTQAPEDGPLEKALMHERATSRCELENCDDEYSLQGRGGTK